MKHLIKLFMWGYQPHFRIHLRMWAMQVFNELGVHLEPDVLLVGALKPGQKNDNPVCIEPEGGKWPLPLFDGLLGAIEDTVKTHPLQNMFYGDEPSMRDKPENIRRDSVTTAVRDALKSYDLENEVQSFCGAARPVAIKLLRRTCDSDSAVVISKVSPTSASRNRRALLSTRETEPNPFGNCHFIGGS